MSARYPDDTPLVGWGDDRQKETLAAVLVVVVFCGLMVLAGRWLDHRLDAAPLPHCKAEDELLVEIRVDGFAWHHGDLRCVHIDNIEPTKEPSR